MKKVLTEPAELKIARMIGHPEALTRSSGKFT